MRLYTTQQLGYMMMYITSGSHNKCTVTCFRAISLPHYSASCYSWKPHTAHVHVHVPGDNCP